MIDLEKLSPILEEYKTYSLLASGYTYPRGMNTNFAKADDEAMAKKSREKTTMSVLEMRRILGIGKTDSYWLVHKQRFETIMVEGKMRVVIDSFEHWYANQVKYKKVDGSPPGEELRAYSYSVQEVADLLGISDDIVYAFIKRDQVETFEVDYWKRIRKDLFEKWYEGQTRYRTAKDKERDRELEETGYTMPEIARMLLISRAEVYNILGSPKNKGVFESFVVAGKKLITKKSFEAWYQRQRKYKKPEDRSQEEQKKLQLFKKQKERPRLQVDPDKQSYSVKETAILLDFTEHEIRRMLHAGELEAKKYGVQYLVMKTEINWWLLQQKL